MKKNKYEMTEQAFLDVWNEFGSPTEINGSKDCYEFLVKLFEVT